MEKYSDTAKWLITYEESEVLLKYRFLTIYSTDNADCYYIRMMYTRTETIITYVNVDYKSENSNTIKNDRMQDL